MAKVYVTEYEQAARDAAGNVVQMPQEPSVACTVLDVTSGAQVTGALSERTRYVLVSGDAGFSFKVGQNPTATVDDTRVGSAMFFGLSGNASGLKVSAITNP